MTRFYPERAAWNMLNALFGPEIDAEMQAKPSKSRARTVLI